MPRKPPVTPRPVSADDEPDLEVLNLVVTGDGDVSWSALHDARTRQPVHAGAAARFEHREIDPLHAADSKFVVIGCQMDLPL